MPPDRAQSNRAGAVAVKRSLPGDGVLHPAVWGSMVVLIANDHWAKTRHPGLVTGKLSDVAGMIFFPLLLTAIVELARSALKRDARPSHGTLVVCLVATGVVFAATKTWAPAADLYRQALSILQWPKHGLVAWLSGRPVPGLLPVRHTVDPTDLFALPALLVPLRIGRARLARPSGALEDEVAAGIVGDRCAPS